MDNRKRDILEPSSKYVKSFQDFKKKLVKYLNTYQIKKIEKAYLLASKAHFGQLRKDGEDYIFHPLSAASLLADLHLDHEAIMAAILHDVIEDTSFDKGYLTKNFGNKVSELVDGVSKLDKINFTTNVEADAANLRKMLLAMSQDIRVILIKLADRKNNLDTISALAADKRRKKARETLEIFAPIALRLGIHSLNKELENLSFKAMHPLRYRILKNALIKSRGNRNELMEKIRKVILKKLDNEEIKTDVIAREKHLYGIYKKMKQKELSFADIHDIFGVRIICSDVDSCYRSLGIVHNSYTPIPGRFKDYIAIPKSNGYQSLHTSILGPHGLPIEIQVRTKQMDIMAQTGIASHWFYKSKDRPLIKNYTQEQQWITNLLTIQKDSGNPQEYLKSIKADLHPGKVYVFTPKGKIIELPKKSTIIDYAYAIHTDVGNNFYSAKLDDKIVSVNTTLKSGQRVEIITKKTIRPDPTWLNFAVTEKARHSIRASLKLIKKKDAIILGERLLKNSLKTFNIDIKEIPMKTLNMVLQEYKCQNVKELFCEIGLGNRIAKLVSIRVAPSENLPKTKQPSEVSIKGTEGLVLSFAKCCYPIPGDNILGHISQEKGIVVHKHDCKSIRKDKKATDDKIDLSWDDNVEEQFNACIKVEVENQRGVLASISSEISQYESDIVSVRYDDSKQTGHNIMIFVITVPGTKALDKLIKNLKKNENVLRVERKKG